MKQRITIIGLIFFSLKLNAQCVQLISTSQSTAQHSHIIKSDGTLWGTGRNSWKTIGNGANLNINTFNRIENDSWLAISDGTYQSCGVKSDGTLWIWGINSVENPLGVPDVIDTNIPIQIGTDTNWLSISTGKHFTIGLKNDGTLWGWGKNNSGQIGQGNTDILPSMPLQIGNDSTWSTIQVGDTHVVALKADGTMWTWGSNFYGQCGNGSNTSNTIPVQIGISTWINVSAGLDHTLAVKSDGTLWSWGKNQTYQLGNDSDVDSNIPIQIGTANNWLSVSAGNGCSFAINTNGALYAWGWNQSGRLGDGTNSISRHPINVASSIVWQAVKAGYDFTTGLSNSGELYTWGADDHGQLGNGINPANRLPMLVDCTNLDTSEVEPITPFALFPNPAEDSIFIVNKGGGIIDKITITDLSGKKIIEYYKYISQISLTNFEKGIYFLTILSTNSNHNYKFIKQ